MFALNWLNPRDLIDTFGTAGLLLVVFIESGLVPAPLPGDSLLFIAGFFCSTKAGGNDPHLNLAVVVLGAFAAALLGAQLGYLLGSRFGTRLFKPDARIFKTEYLERAQVFFDRSGAHGPRAELSRSGTSRMPQRSFVSANLTGAALWAVGVSVLGFFLGKQIGSDNIDKYLLPIVAVIIVLSLIPPFLEYRRHRRQRAAAAETE